MKSDSYVRPGVHVQESSTVPVMAGAPTSIAAFIGRCTAGPLNKATRVRSISNLAGMFGSAHPESELADSVRLFFANGGTECYVVRVGGDSLTASDILGDPSTRTGLHALDYVPTVNFVIIPGDRDVRLSEAWAPASQYCVRRGALLLIDPPAGWTASGRAEAAHNPYLVDDLRRGMTEDSAAVFYPRLRCVSGGVRKTVGPSGAVAGLVARTDAAKGVWASLAGTSAELRSVEGPEVPLTDKEVEDLTVQGINPLRLIHGRCVNWGNRTFRSLFEPTSSARYIPVVRTALFLKESIRRGTAWTEFETNDDLLWSKIRGQVEAFLLRLSRRGAFLGSTPQEGFYVRCGRENITLEEQARGIVNIEVGFAALRPAEFLVVRVRIRAGSSSNP